MYVCMLIIYIHIHTPAPAAAVFYGSFSRDMNRPFITPPLGTHLWGDLEEPYVALFKEDIAQIEDDSEPGPVAVKLEEVRTATWSCLGVSGFHHVHSPFALRAVHAWPEAARDQSPGTWL
jgi:hypothetical protein